ncbi:PREDICTED: 7SK snRNA methylphosphate capping enzyme-like isoform X2 [Poecilia mexicana]|uniref:7SK snRNA methylphosphate capping enzyme-like isoform X2 n=1 Tax=Poecilia mexicana TaxID=48701 RepID=UPI00072DA7CA|nr:PREDICTED: 7SK snRNA methylphosphate capping enzyme-like isoform X2 [Poecilia mexicana]
MSIEEQSAKAGSPKASSASPLQLSDCTGGYSSVSVMMEESAATPDFAAACPVPDTAASPKHTSTDSAGQRAKGSENSINRRNSFHHSKQQQQQRTQSRLTKRRYTASSSFKYPTSGKRRRRANSESDSVLPTNFLLGGNIFDPLNLNSLLDEEVNRALNAETPKSSPLPSKSRDPVEILIPRDITDPLNLNSGMTDSSFLVSPYKSGGRKRHRNRHHGGGAGGASGISTTQMNPLETEKSDMKANTSTEAGGMPGSSFAQDTSKELNSLSTVAGDSHDHSANSSSSCKDDVTSAPAEEATPISSAGTNHHASRRKRRRNSGKMEPPVTHSTPVCKATSGDRSCGTTGQKNSFHTPRGDGPGLRQHQQLHNQVKEHQKKFQYGNYNKYYGYRNPNCSEDPRIHVLRQEWFRGKDVLDLGCNSGHLTLYVAKMFRPARILGLDIDSGLIHAARKNIRHYLSELQTQEARRAVQEKKPAKQEDCEAGTGKKHDESESRAQNGEEDKGQRGPASAGADRDSFHTDEAATQRQDGKTEEMEQKHCDAPSADCSASCSFPVSLRISRGPIAAPPITETCTSQPGQFPANVSFIKANYVLENDNLLMTQRAEYDVILCLSVTKWVHLNWGDSGLKRLFKRAYRHLRPGGLFILEPQPWESYVRRKKLTENINRNYRSIRLKPDQFSSYLTNEVGFTSFEHLGSPKCSVRGFQRPVYVFHK